MGDRYTGWRDRVEALLAKAVLGASLAQITGLVVQFFGSLLRNRVELIAAGTVVGQTVSLAAPAIQKTPDVPLLFTTQGNFLVLAVMNVLSSAVGDEITFQLTRDGTPIGPAPTLTTDANKLATCTIVWSDEAAGAGPFVYAMVGTNVTGADTVATNPAADPSIVVQEEFG